MTYDMCSNLQANRPSIDRKARAPVVTDTLEHMEQNFGLSNASLQCPFLDSGLICTETME
jgi:hypothetical protein